MLPEKMPPAACAELHIITEEYYALRALQYRQIESLKTAITAGRDIGRVARPKTIYFPVDMVKTKVPGSGFIYRPALPGELMRREVMKLPPIEIASVKVIRPGREPIGVVYGVNNAFAAAIIDVLLGKGRPRGYANSRTQGLNAYLTAVRE